MSKEAMKLALEALENLKDNKTLHYTYADKVHMAITVLREELAEQIAQQEQESWEDLHNALQRIDTAAVGLPTFEVRHEGGLDAVTQNIVDAITALHTQPAQQEPDDKRVIELATRYGLDHSMIGALRNFADAYSGKSLSYQKIDLSEDQLQRLTTKVSFIPGLVMDTSPQAQRTWVGLTDVEWMNIVNKDQAWFGRRPDEVAHEVAKLIEARLKEKNT